MTLEKLLLTVPEAAAMTSVGRSTGYSLVASGEWPSILVGRVRRVPLGALRAWVERETRTEAATAGVDRSDETDSRSGGDST